MTRIALLCLCFAGCSDWPDASTALPLRGSGDWPSLVPVAELYDTVPEARASEAGNIAARAAALRARAAILRRSADNQDEMEALRNRLRR